MHAPYELRELHHLLQELRSIFYPPLLRKFTFSLKMNVKNAISPFRTEILAFIPCFLNVSRSNRQQIDPIESDPAKLQTIQFHLCMSADVLKSR